MLFSSYHRIFLENCATEEHEIWFAKTIHIRGGSEHQLMPGQKEKKIVQAN